MQAALRDASGKAEVGILLDYSRATLSVYLNGERLGILADGVGGPLCWMAEMRNSGDTLELREAAPPLGKVARSPSQVRPSL